jgi:hypothetical protein
MMEIGRKKLVWVGFVIIVVAAAAFPTNGKELEELSFHPELSGPNHLNVRVCLNL